MLAHNLLAAGDFMHGVGESIRLMKLLLVIYLIVHARAVRGPMQSGGPGQGEILDLCTS